MSEVEIIESCGTYSKDKVFLTDLRVRLLGVFYNWIDLPLIPGAMLGFMLQGSVTKWSSQLGTCLLVTSFITMGILQIYLAMKGYTISKVLLGRKVLNKNTLKKAHPFFILIRPVMAYGWMMCMFSVAFGLVAFSLAFASTLHREERTASDRAYNNAVNTAAAGASMGFLAKILYKYPKIVWLYDLVCQTTVASVSYDQVLSEIKFSKKANIVSSMKNNEEIDFGTKVEKHKKAS